MKVYIDIPPERIAEAIEENHGNVAAAARDLGVSRATVYNRIKDFPELQGTLDDARESLLDHVESKLFSKALEGDTTAGIFILKTRGKERGYSERHEFTGRDGGAIETRGVIDVAGLTTHELEILNGIADKASGESPDATGDPE